MRIALSLALAAALSGVALTQTPAEKAGARYGIPYDPDLFPQRTPQEALASVIKAMESRNIEYLAAQLADPDEVDPRVREVHRGRFQGYVDEIVAKLNKDPSDIKKLRRFLDEGEWDIQQATASARVKDSPLQVFFRKIGDRWYLQNRREAPPPRQK